MRQCLIAILLLSNISIAQACIDPDLDDSGQIARCIELAKKGHADAQFQLAKRYQSGLGVPPNSTAAEAWYLKAAESGHAEAQYALAIMYETIPEPGQPAKPNFNPTSGLSMLNTSSAGANLGTTFDLCLDIGEGPIKAIKWYRLAAQQGHAGAQLNLGTIYEQGRSVPQDDMLAYMWFDIAIQQGHSQAQKELDIIATRLSAELQTEAQNLATEWLQAHQGVRLD